MTCRILVPPGIGDVYWVLVKLQSFLKSVQAERAELTIVSDPDERGGHLRSLSYLEMFDWFDIGEPPSVPNDRSLQPIWDEAYLEAGRSIFPGVMGYDYLLSWNGRVNSGGWIENDDLKCDWYPPMKLGAQARMDMAEHEFCSRLGSYAVLFWPLYGTYATHVADFPVAKIAEALQLFFVASKLTPVFVGSAWDATLNEAVGELIAAVPKSVNLIGRTDLIQLFGLVRGARIVLGYHAGVTNMAAVSGTKTLLLWDDRYPASTSLAVVPPAVRGSTYRWLPTKGLSVEAYVDTVTRLYDS